MIITYVGDDGGTERWSTEDLSALEAAAVEEAVGGDIPWRGIENLLRAQDVTALRAVLWAFRRRENKDLEFSTFDVPNWKRRLKARIERSELDDVFANAMRQALEKNEDSLIDAMLPDLRNLAEDPDDVDRALDALGKGHLTRRQRASEG
ncbi:hypothetical protein JL475_32680 [Streptomyces sp. M2CJ-2]|uniref:hypothetical protein n=1 Tax=Streptomyces sp. M2CJ-2 TaxID=2803948 RepID=UPI0019291A59|nr:hypothetical protein [Streptomyces sp. M2CJ-2]MBL3670643.1 hypothetical protein [Streptomyces sp. M2CJ-2]